MNISNMDVGKVFPIQNTKYKTNKQKIRTCSYSSLAVLANAISGDVSDRGDNQAFTCSRATFKPLGMRRDPN